MMCDKKLAQRLGVRILYYLVTLLLYILTLSQADLKGFLIFYIILSVVTINYVFFLIERKIFYPILGVKENEELKKIKPETKTYLGLGFLFLLTIGFYISPSHMFRSIFIISILILLTMVSNKIIATFKLAFQTRFLAADIEKTYSTNLSILDGMKMDLRKHETVIKEELQKNAYDFMLRKDFVRMLKEIKILKRLSDEELDNLHQIYDESVLNKGEIEKAKGSTIRFRNQYNLCFHIILSTLIFIVVVNPLSNKLYSNETIISIVVIFLLLEIIQRGVEISMAFYLDIKEGQPKTSNLSNSDRLMLAIKSMIEISLISLSVRLLILDFENVESIFNTILQSFSVGLFNISYSDKVVENIDGLKELIISFTHFSQVVISVLLLTMAIAKYLSNDKDNYDFCIRRKSNIYSSKYVLDKLIKSPYQTKIIFLVEGKTFQELEERCGKLLRENNLTIDEYNSIQTYLYRYCYKKEKRKNKCRI